MERSGAFLHDVLAFLDAGGPVLYALAGLTFLMWVLVFDRLWYLRVVLPHEVARLASAGWTHGERRPWHLRQLRGAQLARLDMRARHHLALIRVCVVLCPLLGLLGTVTGMMVVFDVLASGSGDSRSLVDGVARATIPTMAGMVAAVSGLFASAWVARMAHRALVLAADRLGTGA